MDTAIKHPVPDRLNPVWHRMLYSCTHMTTMGVKGLNVTAIDIRRYTYDAQCGVRQSYGSLGRVHIAGDCRLLPNCRYVSCHLMSQLQSSHFCTRHIRSRFTTVHRPFVIVRLLRDGSLTRWFDCVFLPSVLPDFSAFVRK